MSKSKQTGIQETPCTLRHQLSWILRKSPSDQYIWFLKLFYPSLLKSTKKEHLNPKMPDIEHKLALYKHKFPLKCHIFKTLI